MCFLQLPVSIGKLCCTKIQEEDLGCNSIFFNCKAHKRLASVPECLQLALRKQCMVMMKLKVIFSPKWYFRVIDTQLSHHSEPFFILRSHTLIYCFLLHSNVLSGDSAGQNSSRQLQTKGFFFRSEDWILLLRMWKNFHFKCIIQLHIQQLVLCYFSFAIKEKHAAELSESM